MLRFFLVFLFCLLVNGCSTKKNSLSNSGISDNKVFLKKGYNKVKPDSPVWNLQYLPENNIQYSAASEYYKDLYSEQISKIELNEEYFKALATAMHKKQNLPEDVVVESIPSGNIKYVAQSDVKSDIVLSDVRYIEYAFFIAESLKQKAASRNAIDPIDTLQIIDLKRDMSNKDEYTAISSWDYSAT